MLLHIPRVTEELVRTETERIQRNRVVIYHSPSCWYSNRALALLQRRSAKIEVVLTRGNPDLRTWLREVTGRTSVPQVFIGGRPVGGYTDLLQLELDAELGTLLSPTATDADRT